MKSTPVRVSLTWGLTAIFSLNFAKCVTSLPGGASSRLSENKRQAEQLLTEFCLI